jgi:hypothetical protein
VKLIKSLAIAAITLLAAGLQAAPRGVQYADFRGDDKLVLGTVDGRPVTQREVLLLALVTESVDPEDIYLWETPTRPQQLNAIKGLIESLAVTRFLAAKTPPAQTEEERRLQELGTRIFAGPAAQWVWADTILRESITIFPEDLIFAYRQAAEEYQIPGTATVRRLLVPIPEPGTALQVAAARDQALEIKRQAELEGGLAPILRQRTELLIDPLGRTFDVRADDKNLSEGVADAAFALGLTQISAPIRVSGGFLLMELVERTEPTVLPLNDVKAELVEKLTKQFLPQQFDYLMTLRKVKGYPSIYSNLYRFMADDTDILRVGRFSMTRGEFRALFDEEVGPDELPNQIWIDGKVYNIMLNELAWEDLRRAGLLPNSFLDEAMVIAGDVERARRLTSLRRQALELTPEQIERHLEQNFQTLAARTAKTVWRLDVYLRNPRVFTQAELDTMSILMRTTMTGLQAEAKRQLDERRLLTAGRGIADPERVINNLPQPEDLRLRIRFTRVGEVEEDTSYPLTGLPFAAHELGQFTNAITTAPGVLSAYYVSNERELPVPARPELLRRAATVLTNTLVLEDGMKHLNDLRARNAIVFHPLLERIIDEATGEDISPKADGDSTTTAPGGN